MSCAWWVWPLTGLTSQSSSVLRHCRLTHATRKIVSDMASPGFFSKGVTRLCFSSDGNMPLLKDTFTNVAIISVDVDATITVSSRDGHYR